MAPVKKVAGAPLFFLTINIFGYMICFMEHSFTTRAICRKLGIKERMLIHWAEKRFIRPLQDAEGYSSRRLYSAHNVFEIAVINALWGKASNSAIKVALWKLAEYEGNYRNLAAFLFVWGDTKVNLLTDDEISAGGHSKTLKHAGFRQNLYESKTGIIINLRLISKEVAQLFGLYEIFPE
jgi:hypothetical protein